MYFFGCFATDNNEKIIKGYLNSEAKTLSNLVEKFQLINLKNRVKSDGIDRDYKELYQAWFPATGFEQADAHLRCIFLGTLQHRTINVKFGYQ